MESIKLLFQNGEWDDFNMLALEGNATDIKVSPINMSDVDIPTEDKWKEFLETLKELKIQEWKEYYEHPGILDGHQWTFEIETEKLKIKTGGSNGYPGKDPADTVFENKDSLFEKLEHAIYKLTGVN